MITREEAKNHIKKTCGEGWLNLVDQVFDKLPPGCVITQTYQKWGALMFDVDPYNEEFESYLKNIEYQSEEMCEICGESGDEKIVNNWVETLCNKKSCVETCQKLNF